ncbi:MAG TPA: PKD domain-containing protein [Limnobacter sp.]|nr:PKD domain-containing protein [Limnobacter sp.]
MAWADTQARRPQHKIHSPPPKEHPQLNFADQSRGEEAAKRLKASGKLAQWAQYYALKEAEVPALFQRDRTARLDKQGRFFYVEPANTARGEFPPAQPTIPADQTFFLNSNSQSSKTIYLDFNGYTATGTAWNSGYNMATINNTPFDLDGVPGSFNATELAAIQTVWKMVAEDFAPFDVNVTTQEPTPDMISRSSATDPIYGTRVVITRDFTADIGLPCHCGGFAYLGVFSDTSDFYKPAYVFFNNLGNAKNIAEAVSHEAGHNLGLAHDGTSTAEYYVGHGTGETGWAPIMGVGYGKNLVQWSKGEYLGATQKQDDYLVMQDRGLVFDADEHGDTPATATPLTGQMVNGLLNYKATGILQGPQDVEYLGFDAAAGPVKIGLKPLAANFGNADLFFTLLDLNGTVLGQSNSSETLATADTFTLPAQGTYLLKVEGTGKPDPLGTGYTKYGSIGYWQVLVEAYATNGNQPPVANISIDKNSGLAPLSVLFNAGQSFDPEGSALSYTWDFGDGTGGTGVQISKTYQSIGVYQPTLTVVDASGLAGTASVGVEVKEPATLIQIGVAEIRMQAGTHKVQRQALAYVSIKDAQGRPVPGATLTGRWSGVVNASATLQSDANGLIVSKSPNTKSRGTFTFTVTGLAKQGHIYNSALNVMSSNSITLP